MSLYYKSIPEVATGTSFDENLGKWVRLKEQRDDLYAKIGNTTNPTELEKFTSQYQRVICELNDFDNDKMSRTCKIATTLEPYFKSFEENMISFFAQFSRPVSISEYLNIMIPEVRNMKDKVSNLGVSYAKIDNYLIEHEARFMINLQVDKDAQRRIFDFITNSEVEFTQMKFNYLYKQMKMKYGEYSDYCDFITNVWLNYDFVDGRIGWELAGLAPDKFIGCIQFKTRDDEYIILDITPTLTSKQKSSTYKESYIGREVVINVIDAICSRYPEAAEQIIVNDFTGIYVTDSKDDMEEKKVGEKLSTSPNSILFNGKEYYYGITTGKFLTSIRLAKTILDLVRAYDFKLFFRNKF